MTPTPVHLHEPKNCQHIETKKRKFSTHCFGLDKSGKILVKLLKIQLAIKEIRSRDLLYNTRRKLPNESPY